MQSDLASTGRPLSTRPLPLFALLLVGAHAHAQKPAPSLLELLGVSPSARSVDYVQNKTQFQLHTLVTEQRHPRTSRLSERVSADLPAGLAMLLSVDDDIARRLATLARDMGPLRQLSAAVEKALGEHRKIYVYGCGATGRLAKQMESTFWRPFWRSVAAAGETRSQLAAVPDVVDGLIGEMTGADRALISSLEGFEDLQLIGRLQLADHGIKRGDVVIAVTEGGETSSVIGTILAAHDQWKAAPGYDAVEARKHLYFIYNNPDDRLRPFERSRRVTEQPGITKINLATGPQAITGSTRMQATTIETFVLAHTLQDAAARFLRRSLTSLELARLGLAQPVPLEQRLAGFATLLAEVKRSVPNLAKLTELEAETYRQGHFSTYFANRGLITVFIDSTERSPTFRLHPLDTVTEPRRKCWIQIWTPAHDLHEAWQRMLGRRFRGLESQRYGEPFATEIDDAYLRTAALASLQRAGAEQQELYDFSFSEANIRRSGPAPGDLGVLIAVDDEAARLDEPTSDFARFAALFAQRNARLGWVVIAAGPAPTQPAIDAAVPFVHVRITGRNDPFHVNQQIALKMILNSHSTAIMTRLGKVVGNTMTSVSPSNLKLIGRATYLIQMHVNDVLGRRTWVQRFGKRAPITYAEANAVLFDAIAFVNEKKDLGGQTAAEVPLSIVRIVESLRRGRSVSPEQALDLVKTIGLDRYLAMVIADKT